MRELPPLLSFVIKASTPPPGLVRRFACHLCASGRVNRDSISPVAGEIGTAGIGNVTSQVGRIDQRSARCAELGDESVDARTKLLLAAVERLKRIDGREVGSIRGASDVGIAGSIDRDGVALVSAIPTKICRKNES